MSVVFFADRDLGLKFPEILAEGGSPKVLEFVSAQERPFIAKVYRPSPAALKRSNTATGHVALWYPPPGG